MILQPERVLTLLSRCPVHRETPLPDLPALAQRLGAACLWLKDESKRMGLGSFKALGGAYAVAREVERNGPDQTFCCASAGNHGLSVAAGAQVFGSRAVIFLSETVPSEFEARIRETGARTERFGKSYEESMNRATQRSQEEGWVLVSDSSWPCYLDIPTTVMEGYTVMAWECAHSFREKELWPTHVFLQAGVGGLAAAFTHQVRSAWEVQPKIVVVEPDRAACLQTSVREGLMRTVSGEASNMGRLDCKEPSLLAFEELKEKADDFLTVTDEEATEAAAILSASGYPTTPSGAAGLACALSYPWNSSDRLLLLLTEGSLL